MFKKILTVFIGSMAAIWISAGVMLVLFIMFIGAIMGDAGPKPVHKHSILHLDLSGTYNEYRQKPDIQDAIMNDGDQPKELDKVLEAIGLAADDPHIDCIFIDCAGSGMGYASRQELVEALADFKKSGKKIYAYGDNYTQGDYYVASTADRLVVNPVGMVDIHGIASNIPFFKTLLDRLGVTVQVMKVGRFKSAVEPFIATEPSEASRLQTRVYIDAIWNNISATIAANRGVKPDDVSMWADSLLMTADVQTLLDNKVVDEAKYRRQFEDELRALTEVDPGDDLRLVSASEYIDSDPHSRIAAVKRKLKEEFTNEGYFAVLYAVGDIVDQGNEGIVGGEMVSEITRLADDDDVKGLVMRVNSGGGSAFASEQIWEALQYFKSKGKPFYVSMGDYAASGGYYISCGADRIYCDENTLTGSIGIFGMIPCVQGLLTGHIGIDIADISTGPNANFPSITKPMTDEQKQAMQRYVERGYDLFTSRVAECRGMPQDSVFAIAEGRVWDGATALRIGLVDKMGGIDMAIADMAKALKMSADNYASFPQIELSPIEEIIMSASQSSPEMQQAMSAAVPRIEGLDETTARKALRTIKQMRDMGAVQARMETVTLY